MDVAAFWSWTSIHIPAMLDSVNDKAKGFNFIGFVINWFVNGNF